MTSTKGQSATQIAGRTYARVTITGTNDDAIILLFLVDNQLGIDGISAAPTDGCALDHPGRTTQETRNIVPWIALTIQIQAGYVNVNAAIHPLLTLDRQVCKKLSLVNPNDANMLIHMHLVQRVCDARCMTHDPRVGRHSRRTNVDRMLDEQDRVTGFDAIRLSLQLRQHLCCLGGKHGTRKDSDGSLAVG